MQIFLFDLSLQNDYKSVLKSSLFRWSLAFRIFCRRAVLSFVVSI